MDTERLGVEYMHHLCGVGLAEAAEITHGEIMSPRHTLRNLRKKERKREPHLY